MEAKKNGRVQRSGAEWQEILNRFTTSGRSLAAFCRAEGISRSTLDLWRRKLQAKKTPRQAAKEFVELVPASASSLGSWMVEIELPDGRIARLRC